MKDLIVCCFCLAGFVRWTPSRINRCLEPQPKNELQIIDEEFRRLLTDSLHVEAAKNGFAMSGLGSPNTWMISVGFEPIGEKDVRDKCKIMWSSLSFVALVYRNLYRRHPGLKKLCLFSPIKGDLAKRYEEYFTFMPDGVIMYSCKPNGDILWVNAYEIPNVRYR